MKTFRKSASRQAHPIGAGLVFCLSISLLQATTLRPMNLQEIVQRSSRIFTGECLSASEGVDSRGIPYSLYTFRILEQVKGRFEGVTVTIKQFGIRSRSGRSSMGGRLTRIDGMPDYLPGATYTLFLNNESRLGFSAPIGLLQGAFRVLGKDSGQRVVNGISNRNLLLDTSKTAAQRLAQSRQTLRSRTPNAGEALQGTVAYSAFMATVQRMTRGETISLAEVGRSLRAGGGTR